MAISIDWPNKIINIPRNDLTLIQETPTEIRELNLNNFRMALKSLEDSEEGMLFPDTHSHNTEVLLGGINYARVIEIINGYTITFEDGQYAVNLVGANSNVGDVVNVNSVSVRSANSAGLISSQDIEFASYENMVTVDLESSYSGTLHPVGTKRQPVNNMPDALLIATYRGLNAFGFVGDAVVDSGGDYSGMAFFGESMSKTELIISDGANVYRSEFYDCTLSGTLDGQAVVKDSKIGNLLYINGVIERCLLENGVITLGGEQEAIILDSWSGSSDADLIPIIDMGGSGQNLSIRNYSGNVKIRNLTANQTISITILAGQITLEETITAGTIYIKGMGEVINNTTGTAIVDTNALINPEVITRQVWDTPTAERQTPGTIGGDYYLMLQTMPRMLGLVQENYRLDNTVYDTNGNLTSARIRIYTDSNMDTVMATYLVTASFSNNQLQSYVVVKQ